MNAPKIARLSLRKFFAVVSIGVFAILVTWMIFRPDRVATINELDPVVVAQVRGLFRDGAITPATIVVRFDEADDGTPYLRKMVYEPLGDLVTRRNGKRFNPANEIGVLEETSSLSIGPVLLIRHSREPIPFFGGLLPHKFWVTRTLKRIEAPPNNAYPPPLGGFFSATIWFELRSASNEVLGTEQSQLLCKSLERGLASKLHPNLEGEAMKIRCEEKSPMPEQMKLAISGALPDGANLKGASILFVADSWHVESLGQTIQTWSQEGIALADGTRHGDLTKARAIKDIQVRRPASRL